MAARHNVRGFTRKPRPLVLANGLLFNLRNLSIAESLGKHWRLEGPAALLALLGESEPYRQKAVHFLMASHTAAGILER